MEAAAFLLSSWRESAQQMPRRARAKISAASFFLLRWWLSDYLHYLLINEVPSQMGPGGCLPDGNRDAEGEIQANRFGNEFFSPLTMQKLPSEPIRKGYMMGDGGNVISCSQLPELTQPWVTEPQQVGIPCAQEGPKPGFWADGALPQLHHRNFLIVMSNKK